jgi:hypothetical protein
LVSNALIFRAISTSGYIVPIHCNLYALSGPHLHAFRKARKHLEDGILVGWVIELGKHPICLPNTGRHGSDAYSQTGIVLRGEGIFHRLETVVAAGGASGTKARLSRIERRVVNDDQEVVQVEV